MTLAPLIAALGLFAAPVRAAHVEAPGGGTFEEGTNGGVPRDALLDKKEIPVAKPDDLGSHLANRGAATGEMLYPTPFVLHSLGLGALSDRRQDECLGLAVKRRVLFPPDFRPADWDPPSVKHLDVLSIGEGYSGLVPKLRRSGARAVGLDTPGAYDFVASADGKKIEADSGNRYLDRFRRFLVQGNAFALTKTVKPESQDLVLSHSVFYHFAKMKDEKRIVTAVGEASKVLKPGGQFRFNLALSLYSPKPSDDEVLRRARQWTAGLSADFELAVLRGETRCKARPLAEIRGCFRSDTMTRQDFELELDAHAKHRGRIAEGRATTWPHCEHSDDVVVVVRRKKP